MACSIRFLLPSVLLLVFTILNSSCSDKKKESAPPSFEAIAGEIAAAPDGATIIIPAGTYQVNDEIDIAKNISLIGAGAEQTILISSETGWDAQPFHFRLGNGSGIRISGITFRGAGGDDHSNFLKFNGICYTLRIDHCVFTDGGAHAIMIDGNIRGVIDHCRFDNDSQESISNRNSSEQDAVWAAATAIGTDEAVFIEDCAFIFDYKGDHAVTAVNGARYVFRYNTLDSSEQRNATQIDTHGNYYNERSGFSSEIYHNTLSSGFSSYGIYMRGGRGVIFNNMLTGSYVYPICFTNDGSYILNDGTLLYEGQSFDPANIHDPTYPAIDQINYFYVWGNTCNGSPATVQVRNRGLDPVHIQRNRDFFEPGDSGFSAMSTTYVPYTYPHPLATD